MIEAIVLGDGSPKYEEIVTLLIEGGANVNLADGAGRTPLTLAKDKGYTNIVNILEQARAK